MLALLATHPFTAALALLAIVLIVFVPTAIVAAFKLRRRDLSALLEGCSWAINARMRLDRQQRNQFTRRLPFPAGATGGPRSRWLRWVLVAVLALLVAFSLVRACGTDRPAESRQNVPASGSPIPPPEAPTP